MTLHLTLNLNFVHNGGFQKVFIDLMFFIHIFSIVTIFFIINTIYKFTTIHFKFSEIQQTNFTQASPGKTTTKLCMFANVRYPTYGSVLQNDIGFLILWFLCFIHCYKIYNQHHMQVLHYSLWIFRNSTNFTQVSPGNAITILRMLTSVRHTISEWYQLSSSEISIINT